MSRLNFRLGTGASGARLSYLQHQERSRGTEESAAKNQSPDLGATKSNGTATAEQSHIQILKMGVQAWNTWRSTNPDVKPKLSGVDFTDEEQWGDTPMWTATVHGFQFTDEEIQRGFMDFEGIDFSGAELNGVKFNNANLAFADLSNAECTDGKLRNVDASSANFRNADFTDADFTAAYMWRCDAEDTKFIKAHLIRADLSKANLRGTHFTGADLRDAWLMEPQTLENSKWKEANVFGIRYDRRQLVGKCRALGGVSEMYGDALFQRLLAEQDLVDSLRYQLDVAAPELEPGSLRTVHVTQACTYLANALAVIPWSVAVVLAWVTATVQNVVALQEGWRNVNWSAWSKSPSYSEQSRLIESGLAAIDDILAKGLPFVLASAAAFAGISLGNPNLPKALSALYLQQFEGVELWWCIAALFSLPLLPFFTLVPYVIVKQFISHMRYGTGTVLSRTREGFGYTLETLVFVAQELLRLMLIAAAVMLAALLIAPQSLGETAGIIVDAIRALPYIDAPVVAIMAAAVGFYATCWISGLANRDVLWFLASALLILVLLEIPYPGTMRQLWAEMPTMFSTTQPLTDLKATISALITSVAFASLLLGLSNSWAASRAWFFVWDRVFDCGRDWRRVVVFATVCVAIFGFLYQEFEATQRIAFGDVCVWRDVTGQDLSIQHPYYPWFVATLGFATLGISGIVTPCDGWGQILVLANVVTGFVTLGLMLGVLSSSFSRGA